MLHAQEALPDFPYLSHLPTYDLTDSNDRQFDEFSFFNGKEMVTVEGKFFSKRYSLKQGATPASPADHPQLRQCRQGGRRRGPI